MCKPTQSAQVAYCANIGYVGTYIDRIGIPHECSGDIFFLQLFDSLISFRHTQIVRLLKCSLLCV